MIKTERIRRLADYLQAGMGVLMVWVMYILLMPINRTENDDGYHFGYLLLHGRSEELYQSRCPLFLPFEKFIINALNSCHFVIDPYRSMVWVSSIFAAAALFMFYLIARRRLMMSHQSSLLTMLLLAFSYGFWRYAVEAELYSISHFLIFTTLYLISSTSKENSIRIIQAGFIGAVAVLIYKPNFIPLFLAFPCYFLFMKAYKKYILLQLTGAFFILLGYFVIFFSIKVSQTTYLSYLLSGSDGNEGNPLTSIFVYFSDIASANFLYGFEPIRQLIHQHFPANMIVEEIMTASFYPRLNYLSVFTTISIIILVVYLVYQRLILKTNTIKSKEVSWLKTVMFIWLIIYWVMLSVLDPDSPEPWMMLVPPLIFITGIDLIYKLEINGKRYAIRTFYFLLGLLILHNLAAAIIPNMNRNSDYNNNQGHQIISSATKNDVIICFGSYTEFYYLQYYSQAKVVNANDDLSGFQELVNQTLSRKGTIYLSNDVILTDDVTKFRRPENYKLLKQMISGYRIDSHHKPGTFQNPGFYTLEFN